MSDLKVPCPSCNTVLKLAATVGPGKKIRCPKCATVFAVPGPAGATPPAAPAPPRPAPVAPPGRPAATTGPLPDWLESVEPAVQKAKAPSVAVSAKPRRKSLFARLPRSLRKLVVQGVMLSIGGGILIYALAFAVVFNVPDSIVRSLSDADDDATAHGDKPIDTTYIAADFNGVVVLQPARSMKSDLVADARPMIDKALAELTGLDPKDVEQVVFVLDPYPAGRSPSWVKHAPEWKDRQFTRFTASFPGEPVKDGFPEFENGVRLKHARYLVTIQNGNVLPRDAMNKFAYSRPNSTFYAVDEQAVAPERLAAGAKAYLEEEEKRQRRGNGKDIDIAGYSGKEYAGDVEIGIVIGPGAGKPREATTRALWRVCVAGKFKYEVSVIGPKKEWNEETARKFVDSYKPLPAAESDGDDDLEFDTEDVPFFPGAIVRLGPEVDGSAAMKSVRNVFGRLSRFNDEDGKHTDTPDKNKTYLGKNYVCVSGSEIFGIAQALCRADERTLLIAPETTLRKMLAAGGKASSPLIERLDRLDLACDMNLVVVPGPYQAYFDAVSKVSHEAPEIPGMAPSLIKVVALLARAPSAAVHLNFDRDPFVKVALETVDESTAADLDKELKATIDFYKDLYPKMKGAFLEGAPPEMEKALDALVADIESGHQDNEVTLTVKRPPGMKELVTTLIPRQVAPEERFRPPPGKGSGFKKVEMKIGGEPPAGDNTAKEESEVAEYFKKKGWRHSENRLIILDASLSGDDLTMIARSKALQVLALNNVKNLDDKTLKVMAGIPTLERLEISARAGAASGKITDAGIKELAKLPKLQALFIAGMTVTGSAFEAFAGSKTLRSINLRYSSGFTDGGAKHLSKLPNLDELGLGRGPTLAGIKAIVDGRLPAKFEFDTTVIDDDLLESLVAKGWLYGPTPPRTFINSFESDKPETVDKVTHINLDGSKVTDRGIRAILLCTNVTSLSLTDTQISDAGFQELLKLPKLKRLLVRGTKVSKEAIEKAKKQHPNLRFELF